jgi:uncharacterized protein (DUF2336 family)
MPPMTRTRTETVPETPMTGLDDPSWIRRAMLLEQIAERYASGIPNPPQRRTTEDLFRIAIYDGEPLVRSVLADSLKRMMHAPRDIVLALAHDESQVARPILQSSPVLNDDDLVRIARERSRAHRLAIAERENLSPKVCDALYHGQDPIVVRRLLANDGAALAEGLLHAVLDALAEAPGIVDTMAHRRLLPVSVIDRLTHYGTIEFRRRPAQRRA